MVQEVQPEDGKPVKDKHRGLELQPRDMTVVKLLADARFLTQEQLTRLVFSGRSKTVPSRRLALLCGRGEGLDPRLAELRVVPLFDRSGLAVPTYTLSERGYGTALQSLSDVNEPLASDVGATFVLHVIATNELLVGVLLPAEGGQVDGPRPRGFRWRSADRCVLAFGEYSREKRVMEERLVRPDAAIDLAGPKRRIFIEWESGNNPLDKDVRQSSVAKFGRYHQALSGFSDVAKKVTWYSQGYPDGLIPEVLFVTATEARRDSIRKVFQTWQSSSGSRLAVSAMTLAEAIHHFREVIGQAKPASRVSGAKAGRVPEAPIFTVTDFLLMERYYKESLSRLQEVRHAIRAGRSLDSEPNYPACTEAVSKMLARLRSALGDA